MPTPITPKSLSNHALLATLRTKSAEERKLTLEILHLLKEVEHRNLYLERGYSSLHAFCVDELKYSDDAAQRRIQSMRLLKEIPELETSIQSGQQTLSNVAQVQRFFTSQRKADKKYSTEEKKEVLKRVEGKSRREAEKVLLSLAPETLPQTYEKARPLTPTLTKFEMVFDDSFVKEIEGLKARLSHVNSNFSVSELFKYLVKKENKRLDPACKVGRAKEGGRLKPTSRINGAFQASQNKLPLNSDVASKSFDKTMPVPTQQGEPKVTPPAESDTNRQTEKPGPSDGSVSRKYINVQIKQTLVLRDGPGCSFTDPVTKRRCGSNHQLQIDHIIAVAKGGKTEMSNLRFLCRRHNMLIARRSFGQKHMRQFEMKI